MLSVTKHNVTMKFADEEYPETPYVFKPMLEGNVYEEAFLDYIRSLDLRGVYLDVGAHIGTHTIWFAMQCPSTHVHAFEPLARYAAAVRTNAELNGVSGKVTVHEIGLDDGRPGGAVHPNGTPFDTARLDDLVQDRVAVLKMDVEGMETRVLAGAGRILDRDRPEIFAEAFTAHERKELERALQPYGYRNAGKVSVTGQPVFRFTAPPRAGLERLRPVWRRVPPSFRTAAWHLRHKLGGGVRGEARDLRRLPSEQ
jgi:FkbM family methyltransferase